MAEDQVVGLIVSIAFAFVGLGMQTLGERKRWPVVEIFGFLMMLSGVFGGVQVWLYG